MSWYHPPILISLAATLGGCAEELGPEAPDVILISLDSVRADTLTFLNPASTPNLAKLAERGTVFTQAISGTSWTLPSHLQMFTGLPPALHGVQEDDLRLDPVLPTLPKLLSGDGYQSAGFFTCWYLAGEYGFEDGFDRYLNSMKGGADLDRALAEAMESNASMEQRRRDFRRWKTTDQYINSPVVVANAAKALNEVDDEEPLLLFAHFFDPHFDYIPPAPFGTRFDPDYQGEITGVNYWENERIFDASKSPPRQISDRDLEHIRALYEGEVAWTDAAIGELLATLEERGRLDNTLIIVTADHGEEFFEHGDRGHRRTLYDEVLRVPLLIVPPQASSLSVAPLYSGQVSLSDLLPTVLDYAGTESASAPYGRSLRPAIEGEGLEERPLISSLVVPVMDKRRGTGRGLYESLRLPSEKLIRFWVQFEGDAQPSMQSYEYFDLVADPGELNPVRTLNDKRVRRAWAKLEQAMNEIRVQYLSTPRTPADRLVTEVHAIAGDDLAHLGYASAGEEATKDPSNRLGFAPLPPATITPNKTSK